jgi:hypothetical protein
MPNWAQCGHHDARVKFVAQVVRRFGSFSTGVEDGEVLSALVSSESCLGETEKIKWVNATKNISSNAKQKLELLGVNTLEDANVCMYSCIVAFSRYEWGVRGPVASTKRAWVQERRKLTGVDLVRLIETLPQENDALQVTMEKTIENFLPHVTCTMCKKPIADLRTSRKGRRPIRCSNACKSRSYRKRKGA